MSAVTAIDLSQLPAPQTIATPDFEAIRADLKADLTRRAPELQDALDLESEPASKLAEAFAYREMVLRRAFDDAARGSLLAYASGATLDHLAALFAVERLVVRPAQPDARPPVKQIMEDDDRLRKRTQACLEGFSTAGPRGAYVFHALSASPQVKDVAVASPKPGEVAIAVLSTTGDGTADDGLIATVAAALDDDKVRPLTDHVSVKPATIVTYEVAAELILFAGPDEEVVRRAAKAALKTYAQDCHRLGHDVTLSGLYGALHRPGVQNVHLAKPSTDLTVGDDEAAYCARATITIGGRDV